MPPSKSEPEFKNQSRRKQMRVKTVARSFQKKIFLGVLIVGLFPGLLWAADTRTLNKTTLPKKPTLPTKAPIEKQALELKREAKIKAIGFRTEPSGKWLFTYDIQNTGLATLNLRQAQFKTFQILQNGGRIPVHTVNTGLELRPGQSMTGCYGWNRSSSAIRLQLEMHYEGVLLDSMTTDIPPLDVDITRADFDPAKRKWATSVKNNTIYALKVSVRPIASDGHAGSEMTKIIPAGGSTSCSGVSNVAAPIGLQAIFRDETAGQQPGYAVLDTYNLPFKPTIGNMTKPADRSKIKAIVQDITWYPGTQQWVATVKNNTALPLPVGIAGWPLENGQPGMTIWSNETIPAEGTVQLFGDYSAYSVPPGTRLKVHVLLKPSNVKIHEKIITLN
jgi:hypothetical protein